MTTPDAEFADIQGLLWSGYGPLKQACFLLLRVTDAAAARDWLGATVESVTTIEQLRQLVCRQSRAVLRAEDSDRGFGVRGCGQQLIVEEFAEQAVADADDEQVEV